MRKLAEGLDIQQVVRNRRVVLGLPQHASHALICEMPTAQDVWVPPSNGLQCSRSDGRWGISVPCRQFSLSGVPFALGARLCAMSAVSFKLEPLQTQVPGPGGRDVKWFDAAVIAHNGKCAERLTSSTPAAEAWTKYLVSNWSKHIYTVERILNRREIRTNISFCRRNEPCLSTV